LPFLSKNNGFISIFVAEVKTSLKGHQKEEASSEDVDEKPASKEKVKGTKLG
jgi:hypothetical protein